MTRAIESILATLRADRRRAALVAGVGVAAVVAGILLAAVVLGARDRPTAGSDPSTAATPTATGASASPRPSASLSGDPTPTASPPTTPLPSLSPTATKTPSSPSGGEAPAVGGPGSSYGVTGRWERLADMPGAGTQAPADSLLLGDDRIVVFRWDQGPYESGEEIDRSGAVVIYDPAAGAWEMATFSGEAPFIGTDQPFVLGNDGRIWSTDSVIDPRGEVWTSEPFRMVRETDVWSGWRLAAGPDGRIYRAADLCCDPTQLVIYDPLTDAFSRSSSGPGASGIIISTPDRLLVGHLGVTEYDPLTDTWGDHHQIDLASVSSSKMVWAPEDHVYVNAFDSPSLWRFSLVDDSWAPVQVPAELDETGYELLWGSDDRLYVFGGDRAWAFTPDR